MACWPNDPWRLPYAGSEFCGLRSSTIWVPWKGFASAVRLGSTVPRSSLMYLLFLATCGEARMLAILCLYVWWSMREGPFFKSRSCASVANSASFFMTVMESVSFQYRWRSFCTQIALVPMCIWAKMVHSIRPLPGSTCQLHSRWRHSLMASLYLRIFCSSSASRCRTRSACAEAWVHLSSGGLAILMLIGRSGGPWFLAWTKIYFRSFLSRDKTGQTLALQKF